MSASPTGLDRKLVTPERREDDVAEACLRPQRLAEFIGQEQARANLRVFIEAARGRRDALDHVLFVGPPGLGKTTLAQIVAARARRQFPRHLGAGDRQGRRSRGAARPISKSATCCSSTKSTGSIPRSRRFSIRRWRTFSSTSSSARARRRARSRSTCRNSRWSARRRGPGFCTNPLRDRFGIPVRLNFYTVAELELIVKRGARVLGIEDDRRRRQRDRPPRPRHAAHRRPFAAPGARLRRRRRRRAPSIARSPTRRSPRSRSMPPASTHGSPLSRPSPSSYDGGPVGIETLAAALVRAARRDRGHHRAVSDPVRLPAAHAARPLDHEPRLPASRACRTDT